MEDILYMLRIFIFVLLASVTVVRVGCFTQTLWQEDESQTDVSFSDSVLFTVEVESKMYCAHLCNTNEVKCTAFSYTSNTEECRGYEGNPTGGVSKPSTSLWKRVCRKADFKYDPDFDTCVRLYTIEKTWTEASNTCSNDGTYLLITDTLDKLHGTKYGLHRDTFQTRIRWWVGGYDYDETAIDNYRWINGLPINSTLWGPGEPSNARERCVNLYALDESLNDLDCAVKEYFACQEDI